MRTRFVEQYVKDFNATQAAIRAGYSARSAASQGQRLLKFPAVRTAIAEAQKKLLKAAEVSPAATLRVLAEIAFFDAGEFFDNHGKLRPFDQMPKAALQVLDLKVVELFGGRGNKRESIGLRFTLNLSARIDSLKMLVNYLLKSGPISKVKSADGQPKSPIGAQMKGRGSFLRRRFVVEYLKDFNATQAAIRAGYAHKSAASQGQRLLISPPVGAAIAEAWSRLLENSAVSLERCRDALADIALFDPCGWLDAKGSLLPMKRIPERARRSLTWLRFDELFDSGTCEKINSVNCEIRCPKRAALDMLMEVLTVLDPRGLESLQRTPLKDLESLRRAFFAS